MGIDILTARPRKLKWGLAIKDDGVVGQGLVSAGKDLGTRLSLGKRHYGRIRDNFWNRKEQLAKTKTQNLKSCIEETTDQLKELIFVCDDGEGDVITGSDMFTAVEFKNMRKTVLVHQVSGKHDDVRASVEGRQRTLDFQSLRRHDCRAIFFKNVPDATLKALKTKLISENSARKILSAIVASEFFRNATIDLGIHLNLGIHLDMSQTDVAEMTTYFEHVEALRNYLAPPRKNNFRRLAADIHSFALQSALSRSLMLLVSLVALLSVAYVRCAGRPRKSSIIPIWEPEATETVLIVYS